MTGPEDSVLVLYSGGLDSTLVATLCAKKFKRIVLVTFNIDYTFFVNNSRKYAKQLSELFPDNSYEHHVVNCNKTRRKIWNGFCQDYFTLVDESRRTTHEYEFSAGIDKTIGFLLTPIWWLSRGFFRIGKMVSKRKNSHQADNGTGADI